MDIVFRQTRKSTLVHLIIIIRQPYNILPSNHARCVLCAPRAPRIHNMLTDIDFEEKIKMQNKIS